jgi:hypothetical protein
VFAAVLIILNEYVSTDCSCVVAYPGAELPNQSGDCNTLSIYTN